jgi:hypothetical protein
MEYRIVETQDGFFPQQRTWWLWRQEGRFTAERYITVARTWARIRAKHADRPKFRHIILGPENFR